MWATAITDLARLAFEVGGKGGALSFALND